MSFLWNPMLPVLLPVFHPGGTQKRTENGIRDPSIRHHLWHWWLAEIMLRPNLEG